MSRNFDEQGWEDDKMHKDDVLSFLQSEVDRAIVEIRAALGDKAKTRKTTPWIGRICTLLDRIECHVIPEEGDSAFELDEKRGTVSFRGPVLAKIWAEMDKFASEVDPAADLTREKQLAINQFVIHELIHIRQNFPHFATVDTIKNGLPGYGLPMLDVAADIASAWICAHVELHRNGSAKDDFHAPYLNALLRAYIVGAYVFDSRKKPEKRQRAIGLLISAALVFGVIKGTIRYDALFDEWSAEKPVMAFDFSRHDCFNAFVFDVVPGLLIASAAHFDREVLDPIWNGVGRGSVGEIFRRVIELLIASGVIEPCSNAN